MLFFRLFVNIVCVRIVLDLCIFSMVYWLGVWGYWWVLCIVRFVICCEWGWVLVFMVIWFDKMMVSIENYVVFLVCGNNFVVMGLLMVYLICNFYLGVVKGRE